MAVSRDEMTVLLENPMGAEAKKKKPDDIMAYLVQDGHTLFFSDKKPDKKRTYQEIKYKDNANAIADKVEFAEKYTDALYIYFNHKYLNEGRKQLALLSQSDLRKMLRSWKHYWTGLQTSEQQELWGV